MKTLAINAASAHYPLYIGSGLLQHANLLQQHIQSSQVCIISNALIAKHYLAQVKQTLANKQCLEVLLPNGEKNKTLTTLTQIFDTLIANGFRRDATLIALGGGVIGDMTGFAASCYQRGMPFIQIPTSLLAQVDASIGGKTAVNYQDKKNFIGAFYQPQAVFIDINTLRTLPRREFISGLAEVIKHAVIKDAEFFIWLEKNIPAILQQKATTIEEMLYRSAQIKAAVIAEDETESKGIRELLNFGHTFAHAIESATAFKTYLHGEAVAIGMVMAAQLSEKECELNSEVSQRLVNLLQLTQLPTQLKETIATDTLNALMKHDKKNRDQQQRFVLLENLGSAKIKTLPSNMKNLAS